MINFIKKFFSRAQSGQSLVELLVAMGLATLLLPALLTGISASRGGRAQHDQRLQATAYLKQAQEAVRSIAQQGWSGIATNGTYHPEVSGSSWILSPGTQDLNGFILGISISDVYRDSSGAIATSAGAIDPSTKKVVTYVSWSNPYVSSVSAASYFTRYKNAVHLQTTVSDFNAGVNQGTNVTNTNGGEVTLGAGGGGNWCSPNLSISALDLPKSGVANAVTAIEGRAFAGTGENASGESFANVNISNTNPPVTTIAGTFSNYKTNDVFGEANYGYIATDTNSKEVVIVDSATNPYAEAGYFDAPGNSDALGVFVAGSTGYVTTGNKLYNFDLSSKAGSRPARDADGVYVSLFGQAGELYVVGNYAYVTIGSYAFRELVIVNISNPTNLQVVGWADVNGESGQEVYVNSSGTRAYLATDVSASKAEFFIIDVSNKTGNRPTFGSYNANGMDPKGITVVTGNKAILVGFGAEEYQVIDVTNENSPTRCGGLHIDSGINEVSSVLEADGDAYSYIVTSDVLTEFKIIEGGPGGQFSTSGTFTSNYFDGGATVVFNGIFFNFAQPGETSIKFQVAAASGDCSSATYYFVGPDGTQDTYYVSSSGAIPLMINAQGYTNPGQCIKYKAYLTTNDTSSSPILNDVSINYSP